jgi:hypothetical protein
MLARNKGAFDNLDELLDPSRKSNPQKILAPISFDNLKGTFWIFLVGNLFSLIVFTAELMTWKVISI